MGFKNDENKSEDSSLKAENEKLKKELSDIKDTPPKYVSKTKYVRSDK